jgi:hypothetical protein
MLVGLLVKRMISNKLPFYTCPDIAHYLILSKSLPVFIQHQDFCSTNKLSCAGVLGFAFLGVDRG